MHHLASSLAFILYHPAGVFREATTDFTVDARALTKVGGPHIKAKIKNPSGAATDCSISDQNDGTYKVEYTPFENGTAQSAQFLHSCVFLSRAVKDAA